MLIGVLLQLLDIQSWTPLGLTNSQSDKREVLAQRNILKC